MDVYKSTCAVDERKCVLRGMRFYRRAGMYTSVHAQLYSDMDKHEGKCALIDEYGCIGG